MATTNTKAGLSITPSTFPGRLMPVKSAPAGFDAARDLPDAFLEFLAPLHAALTLRQRALIARREAALQDAHAGKLPDFLQPSVATTQAWEIELPEWCSDQRNQMTGPADDAELVVKMLNSGAPGVMLDLEDSNANTWEHLTAGIHNVLEALAGRLNYFDKKRNRPVSIQPSKTVLFTRPRGLHLHQAGVLPGELLPASLFDVEQRSRQQFTRKNASLMQVQAARACEEDRLARLNTHRAIPFLVEIIEPAGKRFQNVVDAGGEVLPGVGVGILQVQHHARRAGVEHFHDELGIVRRAGHLVTLVGAPFGQLHFPRLCGCDGWLL